MNPYFQHVIDLHIAIEQWLGKGAGELPALLSYFTDDFSMVTLGGGTLDKPALAAFFTAHGNARPGLAIDIEEMALIAQWPQGAVVSYQERQRLPGQPAHLRRSTVVFSHTEAGLQWRHLHETPVSGA